jgi:putative peptidoglycan lipid II flippase
VVVAHRATLEAGPARHVSAAPPAPRVTHIAAGTLASRASGLLRVLVLAWVLGFTPLADAYNLANTVPNMLYDIVLGGVLSATFIPVFVERLAHDGERRAWRSISTVVTAGAIVLVLASVLAFILAPEIISAFTVLGSHGPHSAGHLALEQSVATSLLRWFSPQILFYGLIGMATALLNVRHRFNAPAWVPIANNVVCIAVLVWFHAIDPAPTLRGVQGSSTLVLLGLGTTVGVLVQLLLLGPSLARADVWRLSPRLDLKDPALRTITRLGTWTFLVVVANQASLYVILAIAFGLGGSGSVTAFTYGWSFMQMPYAVVVVSVLNALTPRLAALSTSREHREFSRRLGLGMRQSLVIIIPIAAMLVVLAQPIVAVLLNHGNASHTLKSGTALAVLAAGLPGFTAFQVSIRGLQAMQRARDTFWLYFGQNAATIALALAIGRHGLGGLCASVSIAYLAAAIAAVALLAVRGANLIEEIWNPAVGRALYASVLGALAAALAYNARGWPSGVGLFVRLALAVLAGVVVYGGLQVLGHRRHERRRRRPAESAR